MKDLSTDIQFLDYAPHLRQIDLAQAYNDDKDAVSIYNMSGMNILAEELDSITGFRNNPAYQALYFEYTVLSSALNDFLPGYYYLYERDPQHPLLRPGFQNNFPKIVNGLLKNKCSIYYHPDFFLAPKDAIAYRTFLGKENRANLGFLTAQEKSDHDLLYERVADTVRKISGSVTASLPLMDLPENAYIGKSTFGLTYNEVIKAARENRDGFKEVRVHHTLLHSLYDEFLLAHQNHTTALLSIPIVGGPMSKEFGINRLNGHFPFYAYFVMDDSVSPAHLEKGCFDRNTIRRISTLLKDITYSYLYSVGLQASQVAGRNSRKSAMAAIMARNISHNLGSHVLSYIKADLGSTSKIISSGILDNMLGEDLSIQGGLPESELTQLRERIKRIGPDYADSTTPHAASYLLGLGRLVNYIQERQDYIATIASGAIPYFSAVNFKDHVLDEFTHDAKARRHSESQELQQNLLLKYIILSEGVSRSFSPQGSAATDIEFKLSYQDHHGHVEVFQAYNPGKQAIAPAIRSLNIEIPAGIMGRQALFSILENIIRNTAKHENIAGKLEFEIHIEDTGDIFYGITILSNGETATDQLVKTLNDKINERLVDRAGRLNESNKGLKEIFISAAWLRNIAIAELENKNDPYPIVQAIRRPNGNLGYTFYLFKARKIALVTDRRLSDETMRKISAQQGWQVFSIDDFLRNTFSYRLYIVDRQLQPAYQEEITRRYPSRVLFEDLATALTGDNYDELYLQWYETCIKKNFGLKELPSILISDKIEQLPLKSEYEKLLVTGTGDWADTLRDNIRGDTLLFKEHLNNEQLFKDFYQEQYLPFSRRIRFVEAITGHNSTDRLIRHETLNKEWWLKMVESGLTRILLIDERLWQKLMPLQQDPAASQTTVATITAILESEEEPIRKTDKIGALVPHIPGVKIVAAVYDGKWTDLLNLAGIPPIAHQVPRTGDHKTMLYQLNNIQLGTFLHDKINDTYNLYLLPQEGSDEDNHWVASISRKGELTQRSHDLAFDFVVIHQGILDKYKLLTSGIPEEISSKELFGRIKNIFTKNQPRYIIHSGRSRPSPDVYPDPAVPFIQYSSVESSFNDCKYTLTDLLYSAINTDRP